MSSDFVPYVLNYLPGSFEEGFYAGKNAGIVASASQQAGQMRVARDQGQPDQTPYYIVFSKNKNKYIAIANNVYGTSDQNFDRVAEDVAHARALSELSRRAQSGEAVDPGQGGGRRHRKGRKSHRKSHRKSRRRHL